MISSIWSSIFRNPAASPLEKTSWPRSTDEPPTAPRTDAVLLPGRSVGKLLFIAMAALHHALARKHARADDLDLGGLRHRAGHHLGDSRRDAILVFRIDH